MDEYEEVTITRTLLWGMFGRSRQSMPNSKFVCAWWVGNRDSHTARLFINDLASRLSNRVQLSSDGHRMYPFAINSAFKGDIDYGIIVKHYGTTVDAKAPQRRYSAPESSAASVSA